MSLWQYYMDSIEIEIVEKVNDKFFIWLICRAHWNLKERLRNHIVANLMLTFKNLLKSIYFTHSHFYFEMSLLWLRMKYLCDLFFRFRNKIAFEQTVGYTDLSFFNPVELSKVSFGVHGFE